MVKQTPDPNAVRVMVKQLKGPDFAVVTIAGLPALVGSICLCYEFSHAVCLECD